MCLQCPLASLQRHSSHREDENAPIIYLWPNICRQCHTYCKESKKASFGEIVPKIKFYCLAVLIPEALGKLQISGKLCKVSLFYYFSTVFPFNSFSNILMVKENKLIGIAFHGLLSQGREKIKRVVASLPFWKV